MSTKGESNSGAIWGWLLLLLLLAYGLAQVVAGFIGIRHHWGTGWAIGAVAVAFLLRFSLPLTVGAFFGAMNVWGWHWSAALIFAAPSLLFTALMIPGVLAAALAKIGTGTSSTLLSPEPGKSSRNDSQDERKYYGTCQHCRGALEFDRIHCGAKCRCPLCGQQTTLLGAPASKTAAPSAITKLVVNKCERCGGLIEFDETRAGEYCACPLCGKDTKLTVALSSIR
jgi:hypothetical protein